MNRSTTLAGERHWPPGIAACMSPGGLLSQKRSLNAMLAVPACQLAISLICGGSRHEKPTQSAPVRVEPPLHARR
jgi:hypothetical protein